MRRLLLLLLTFLLPLQLLAATVVDLPSSAAHAQGAMEGVCKSHAAVPTAPHVVDLASLPAPASAADGAAASSDSGAGQEGDEDDSAPAVQAELEDHTLPARIATPDIPWQPFPHAFSTPLSWASFVRDQQRPPPLA